MAAIVMCFNKFWMATSKEWTVTPTIIELVAVLSEQKCWLKSDNCSNKMDKLIWTNICSKLAKNRKKLGYI